LLDIGSFAVEVAECISAASPDFGLLVFQRSTSLSLLRRSFTMSISRLAALLPCFRFFLNCVDMLPDSGGQKAA